jgi:hypothetical protein
MRARWASSIFVASLLLTACAEDLYVYRPTEQATARVGGLPAARYGIPQERPLGTVLIASPGLARVGFSGGAEQRMLSLRVVVSNNADDTPWTVDTREVRAIVLGAGESRPAYANADSGLSPLLQVPRGHKTTIDLFYPLPADRQDAKHVPEFDVIWQVQTGQRLVVERTPFERLEIEPEPYPYGVYAGSYWPYWWYDPFWPGPSYLISPGFFRYPVPPVYVAPVPVHRPAR